MKRVAFAIPGDLDGLTGGYGYDRRVIAELRHLCWTVDTVGLGAGFPFPDDAQRAQAEARLFVLPDGQPIIIDGLAFAVLPEIAAALSARHALIALVHHPLALEAGLNRTQSDALRQSEQAALRSARRVIATSRTTADLLVRDFGVAAERLDVVLPGTDPATFSAGGSGSCVQILSVGAISTRKGFDHLVEALAPLGSLDWHLTIAGDRRRDPEAVARLDAAIAHHRLQHRIACVGAVSSQQLAALYATADLFALASLFEGYGMAYAEAIAHGLPVIGTTGGAIPEVVSATAGRLVPPGDVAALSAVLRETVEDGGIRRRLAAGARAAAKSLPAWPDSGARFAAVLDRLA